MTAGVIPIIINTSQHTQEINMSRTKAINEYCKSCIYDQKAPGTYREQVEACKSGPESKVPCALWIYRPVSVSTVNNNRKPRGDGVGADIDALINGLEDDDDNDVTECTVNTVVTA